MGFWLGHLYVLSTKNWDVLGFGVEVSGSIMSCDWHTFLSHI